jgi:hypothetical protein
MKGINIDRMSIDELTALEDEIRETLAARSAHQKSILERRLRQLTRRSQAARHRRRPYPRVLPKYRKGGY